MGILPFLGVEAAVGVSSWEMSVFNVCTGTITEATPRIRLLAFFSSRIIILPTHSWKRHTTT